MGILQGPLRQIDWASCQDTHTCKSQIIMVTFSSTDAVFIGDMFLPIPSLRSCLQVLSIYFVSLVWALWKQLEGRGSTLFSSFL